MLQSPLCGLAWIILCRFVNDISVLNQGSEYRYMYFTIFFLKNIVLILVSSEQFPSYCTLHCVVGAFTRENQNVSVWFQGNFEKLNIMIITRVLWFKSIIVYDFARCIHNTSHLLRLLYMSSCRLYSVNFHRTLAVNII